MGGPVCDSGRSTTTFPRPDHAHSHSAATELAQLLNGASAGEHIPELVCQGLQALIEAEAAAAIGADRHERTAQRRGHRNGSRDRLMATPAGDIQLRIPRFRTDSFFPSLLEPRRRVDRTLWAVVMEAYVSGVSTRKVDELVVALAVKAASPNRRSAASARASTPRCKPY